MEALLEQISSCRICSAHLAHGCRPVVQASPKAKIAIIGQAPGRKVHETGIPFDDASGDRLREWMGISKSTFYDRDQIAIVPMGFCYPGTGRSGDYAPRKECAPEWHQKLFEQMPEIELTLLIGQYAQAYYLRNHRKSSLTETVRHFSSYLPEFLPLPHPSPRNNIWLKKNQWFETTVLPSVRSKILTLLNNDV